MGSNIQNIAEIISSGTAVLGIELGSTRIKAVLIGPTYKPIASGGHSWENRLEQGIWTYSLDDIHSGIQSAYANLKAEVTKQYGVTLKNLRAMGVSGMMHGYLAFDSSGNLLTPFRTWRNNITQEAAEELTELLCVNIPQRWSIAHLHHLVKEKAAHLEQLDFMTTLAGYIHWQLTGSKVLGIGDASGMFPVANGTYDRNRVDLYNEQLREQGHTFTLEEVFPKVLLAGDAAGSLTEQGARFLDPAGDLMAGIPLAPPEGDAGTGMVATNAVDVRSGNVSAGTSIFAMIVMEKPLSQIHEEIDLVATPDGSGVAMVHSNNCASDLDAWVSLFQEAVDTLGLSVDKYKLMDTLMGTAIEGDKDCGGLLSYGYLSGEHLTGFSEGRPLFLRSEGANFSLANFMRAHFYTALCALRKGMDILTQEEQVKIDSLCGHGGFFKALGVGNQIMADAFQVPVTTMATAGEGGAWGIALLAAYLDKDPTVTLPKFLGEVFTSGASETVQPDQEGVEGFTTYFNRYIQGLSVEAEAVTKV